MEILKGNALIGQSGGPTAVINQSLVGIIEAARSSPHIDKVYGMLHGVRGILEGMIIDLGAEAQEGVDLDVVAGTPAAALGSVRKKPTKEDCTRILEAFQRLDVRYFFYIGGNDSAETAYILNEEALAQGYDVRLFHVPKTIDNDLCETDHCPGYPSAAKYVIQALMGDNLDNESLPGVKVDVIMGRHAGWLAASSILARRFEGDGPHLIYVPEHGHLDPVQFVEDVRATIDRTGRCLVAMSEGMKSPKGDYLLPDLLEHYMGSGAAGPQERDSHGNVQLSGVGALGDTVVAYLKQELKIEGLRARADTFGYPQRCFAGLAAEVDSREARAVGRYAVQVATAGEAPHGSIVIRREPGATYESTCALAKLEQLAQKTRTMDASYLKGHNDIDPSFVDYLAPLVAPLPKLDRLKRDLVPEARPVASS